MTSSVTRKIAATCALIGFVTVGIGAAPKPANAWWYPYGYGWGYHPYVPPIVIAPRAYYPAPAYYAAPGPAWIPGHYMNGYWVPGHWS